MNDELRGTNDGLRAKHDGQNAPKSNKFCALNPLLETEFPTAGTDGYAKKDVDSFVSFLGQLKSGSNTYTVAEALQIAEHLSPKPSGVFSKGYDRQHVDAFTARVVGLLKTL